jgi:heavy metal sensor kinase
MRVIPRTVTFRIALLYVGLSAAVAGAVFCMVYFTLARDLMNRTDEDLLDEVGELRYIHETRGREGAYAELKILEKTDGINSIFARILDPGLSVIAYTEKSTLRVGGIGASQLHELKTDTPLFITLHILHHHHSVRLACIKSLNGTIYQIGRSLRDDDEILKGFRKVFLRAFVILLICGGIVGWFLTRRAMQGVARVQEAALRIGKGDFDSRVPLGDEGREIIDLAVTFNEMIEKIQTLIKDLGHVTDNIAHDLRSPVTRMRGAAETTLTGDQTLAEYQEMAGMVVEECDRLVSMINTMLEIAESDAGAGAAPFSPVDMNEVARDAYELFEDVAAEKGLRLELDCPETRLPVPGDRARLQRAVSNLIDNAVKFTPDDGHVMIRCGETPAHVVISIIDDGPGLEEKDMDRVFDRFYRGDRSRSTPGNGLGLSLVKAVVKAHHGEVAVQSAPGKGSTFTVTLPRHS